MTYLKCLQTTIKRLHGCDSTWLESATVKGIFGGNLTSNSGEIEIFKLRGHPKAKRCFAWSYKMHVEQDNTKYLTVLELPPVDSAQTAVDAVARKIKNASTIRKVKSVYE